MTLRDMEGQELAAKIGKHPSHISRLLRGHADPDVATIAALGAVFEWDDAQQGRIVRMVAGGV